MSGVEWELGGSTRCDVQRVSCSTPCCYTHSVSLLSHSETHFTLDLAAGLSLIPHTPTLPLASTPPQSNQRVEPPALTTVCGCPFCSPVVQASGALTSPNCPIPLHSVRPLRFTSRHHLLVVARFPLSASLWLGLRTPSYIHLAGCPFDTLSSLLTSACLPAPPSPLSPQHLESI